ncbi:progonadoliberin-1 [Oenanthe melanoleuca]|uniref:progonadoliberin-1 n=1 Tax=Oenanthe melanoleuca TaxID=2939378 RepID=UPI0024C1089F|nr:progonadoliberin-1 [Oenanthe melanoleuca]
MGAPRRAVFSVLLCAVAAGLCLAQHWSHGLQPGGKRSGPALLGPLQEVANEMGKLEEVQQSECPEFQNSRIRDLKEAMERLVEGEGRRKI